MARSKIDFDGFPSSVTAMVSKFGDHDTALDKLEACITAASNGDTIVALSGKKLGFYGTAAIAKQTGVAVDAAGIHAALVALGLIAA